MISIENALLGRFYHLNMFEKKKKPTVNNFVIRPFFLVVRVFHFHHKMSFCDENGTPVQLKKRVLLQADVTTHKLGMHKHEYIVNTNSGASC